MGTQALPYDGRSRRSTETKPTTFETLTGNSLETNCWKRQISTVVTVKGAVTSPPSYSKNC